MAKAAAGKSKPLSKTELVAALVEETGVVKKDVAAVLAALSTIVGKNVGKKGPGAFTLPGLLKIVTVHKPATPAKKGVPNPFKPGETMDVPAKKARTVVKVRPLKALKDMV